MGAPATIDEFLELVYKSDVVDRNRVKTFLERPGQDAPADAPQLAKALFREGILTRFQAEQLLQGRWRRFTIGSYKVLERLGSGGMGNVFLCEHMLMRHQVAIKVLSNRHSDDPTSVKRFFREGQAAAALVHPNVVRAHDLGSDQGLHYLVMEYVFGTNLQEIVERHGPLSIERVTNYIYQAALGLHHAHINGLVHRDVKPANLILERSGTVKLLDLGMALFNQGEEEKLTNHLIGTADYLAPEQARDSHRVDLRADIYSLGATFYFLVTGTPPFGDAKSLGQKLIALQTRPPRPVREIRPEIPPRLAAVLEKMMDKDAAKRYQSLAEVIGDLKPWTEAPVPPPADIEMPRLSPAAKSPKSTEFDLSLSAGPVSGGRPSIDQSRSAPILVRSGPPLWLVVTLSAAVTTAVLVASFVAIWWLFLRPAA